MEQTQPVAPVVDQAAKPEKAKTKRKFIFLFNTSLPLISHALLFLHIFLLTLDI